MTKETHAGEDSYIMRVKAVVMTSDDSSGGMVPTGRKVGSKKEQLIRTISSLISCEHQRIYTLGHLHDPHPTDHYHLEQLMARPYCQVSFLDD
eukprot:bmy_08443T0